MKGRSVEIKNDLIKELLLADQQIIMIFLDNYLLITGILCYGLILYKKVFKSTDFPLSEISWSVLTIPVYFHNSPPNKIIL